MGAKTMTPRANKDINPANIDYIKF